MRINEAIKELMSDKCMCAVHKNWTLNNMFLVKYDEDNISEIFKDRYTYGDVEVRVVPGLALITKYGNFVYSVELNPSIFMNYRKYNVTGTDWELIPFGDKVSFNKKIENDRK